MTKYDLCEIARRSVPEFASGEWQVLSCLQTDVLKDKESKSLVASFALSYRKPGQTGSDDEMVAKLYRKHRARARTTYEGTWRLWETGFKPPSPFRVPLPYGYSLEPPVLFMQRAPGKPWRELIFVSQDDLLASSQKGADWLLRLHDCGIHLHRANQRVITARVQRFSRELAPLYPVLASRLDTLVGRIIQALLQAGELKPSHGDFHSGNLFVTSEVATGIDFDNLALREPAFDVGYAIGHLLMRSWYQTGSHRLGAQAASAFLHQYLGHNPIELARVRLHIGRAIFQSIHYSIVMRNPRVNALEPWLDLIEQFLETGERLPILEV